MMRSTTANGTLWIALLLLCTIAPGGVSESLWTPSFDGHISGGRAFDAGDILTVSIDTVTNLSFKASRSDSRSISIELSGGEAGGVFSFLPTGTSSSSSSLSGDDELELSASLAVRIVEIEENGTLQIQGSRTVRTDRGRETVTISGAVDPGAVDDGGRVSSSMIADLSIVYTGLIDPTEPVLEADDVVRTETAPASETDESPVEPAPGEGEAPEAAAAEAEPGDETTPAVGSAGVELSEEKREELLLRYLNRMIELILRER